MLQTGPHCVRVRWQRHARLKAQLTHGDGRCRVGRIWQSAGRSGQQRQNGYMLWLSEEEGVLHCSSNAMCEDMLCWTDVRTLQNGGDAVGTLLLQYQSSMKQQEGK